MGRLTLLIAAALVILAACGDGSDLSPQPPGYTPPPPDGPITQCTADPAFAMTRRETIRQSSFGAGEFAPRALGRTDLPQYGSGLKTLRNFIVSPQGSATRRPAFKHIGVTKTVSAFAATERSSGTGAFDLNDVVYASELGLWVAVGDTNGTEPVIVWSDDGGVTWTAAGTVPNENCDLYAVTWSGSLFVAVGAYDGTTNTTIFTSTDGDTWTSRSAALTGTPDLHAVLWTGSIFVAAGDTIIITSSDGTTWTERDTSTYGRLRGAVQDTGSGDVYAVGFGVAQVGNDLSIAGLGAPAITALSATRIAYIDASNDELRAYDWDGTGWAQFGSSLSITSFDVGSVAALSSTRIALADQSNRELRTYDLSAGTWSQTGNGLSITGAVLAPALAGLSSSRVAYIDLTNNDLRTYEFDGSDWSQVGNDLNILGMGSSKVAICAMSSTRIALLDTGNDDLRVYDFNGTDWSQTGSDLALGTVGFPALAALTSSRIAMIDGSNNDLRTYEFDGSNWAQVGNDLNIATVGDPALAALSSSRVAFIDSTNDDLRTYRIDGVAKSTNGGTTYSNSAGISRFEPHAMFFDGGYVYMAGQHLALPAPPFSQTADGAIYRSNDGGSTWTNVYSSGTANEQLRGMARFGTYLVAVGEAGTVVSSSDSGATWAAESDIDTLNHNGVALGNGRLHIVGDDDASDANLFTLFTDTTGRRILPFIGSTGNPYIVELGHLYMRFWRDEGQVESSPGTPLEVTTPWSGGELAALQFAQANDVMYIVHGSYAPRKLERTGEATFTLTDLMDESTVTVNRVSGTFKLWDGPYLDENATVTTLTLSATGTGSKTATASANLFASTDVGRPFRIFSEVDGSNLWGWGVITGYTNPTTATVFMVEDPSTTSAETRWALGAWSATTGYPRCVSFFGQRLCFANTDTEPMRVWTSIVGSFEEFDPTDVDDTVLADNGLSATIAARRMLPIQWLEAGNDLNVGTRGGVFRIDGGDNGAPMSPISLRVRLASGYGAGGPLPELVGDVLVYAQQGKRIIRALSPRETQDVLNHPDLTLLAEHITESGVEEMVFASAPSAIVWMRRADGLLLGMTLNPETRLLAWHKHTLPGSLTGSDWPKVLSIAVLPIAAHDQLWAITRRTVDGSVVEHLEALQLPFDSTRDDREDARYLDAAALYEGPDTTAISGLDHLEGESVYAMADGIVQGPFTVSSGAITLSTAAGVVWTGLDYDDLSDLEVLPVKSREMEIAKVRITTTNVEVLDTMGLRIGVDSSNLQSWYPHPQPSSWTGAGLRSLETGDGEDEIRTDTLTRPTKLIRPDGPYPATVVGLTHIIEYAHV